MQHKTVFNEQSLLKSQSLSASQGTHYFVWNPWVHNNAHNSLSLVSIHSISVCRMCRFLVVIYPNIKTKKCCLAMKPSYQFWERPNSLTLLGTLISNCPYIFNSWIIPRKQYKCILNVPIHDFNPQWDVVTYFNRNPQHEISWKIFLVKVVLYVEDGSDKTRLTVSSDSCFVHVPSWTESFPVAWIHIWAWCTYFPAHEMHFFPEKMWTCVLCAEGMYYFQTYKYPYPHRVKTTIKMILVAVTMIFWPSMMKLYYGC